MKEQQDLRVQKTYRALNETFLALLEEKSFENITVEELCSRAMIRRATFYRHFADKYDFFHFFIRTTSESFLSESNFSGKDPVLYLNTITRAFVDFLDSRERLIETTCKSNMLSVLIDMIAETVADKTCEILKESVQTGKSLPASPELLGELFAGALLNGVKWWVAQKKRLPKEEFLGQLSAALLSYYTKLGSS